jgi:type 1 glutamine amidotransferase
VLIKLDEKSYNGGENGDNHSISWYHDFDGGRAFYTGLGHTKESYKEQLFLQHLAGGIIYAIGKNRYPKNN